MLHLVWETRHTQSTKEDNPTDTSLEGPRLFSIFRVQLNCRSEVQTEEEETSPLAFPCRHTGGRFLSEQSEHS